MSLSNIVQTQWAERLRVSFVPLGGVLTEVDVIVNLRRVEAEQVQILEVPTGSDPRARVLGTRDYPFNNVYSDLSAGQQASFLEALRVELEGIFALTIPLVPLIVSSTVTAERFAATFNPVSGATTNFVAIVDSTDRLIYLFSATGTEALGTFRNGYGAWPDLSAAERTAVRNAVDSIVGLYLGQIPA